MSGLYKTRKNQRFFVSRKHKNPIWIFGSQKTKFFAEFKKFSRKAETGLVVILILVIVVLFFGWLINISQRECRSNRDCGSEAYCGSDFSCHPYPTIQKTVIQYNLFWSAVIISIAIIIVAWIFREGQIRQEEAKKMAEDTNDIEKAPEEVKDISEPYYKSNSNIKTP